MGKVFLKMSPSLSSVSGFNRLRWFTFEKELEAGDTIGSLLEAAVSDHAGLRQRIFDPESHELSGEILVVRNDSLLQSRDVTQVKLKEGDAITLLLVDIGG